MGYLLLEYFWRFLNSKTRRHQSRISLKIKKFVYAPINSLYASLESKESISSKFDIFTFIIHPAP